MSPANPVSRPQALARHSRAWSSAAPTHQFLASHGESARRLTTPYDPPDSEPMSSAAETTAWRPSVNPWLIAAAVMLATILEVLDTSVANVAIPNIAGSLSASTDEATWVLTSYLVSNAIVLPMTGWLCGFFGRKRFLIA